ncbi:hypothetical protein EJB05_17367, partial [Eragrostis curvula]
EQENLAGKRKRKAGAWSTEFVSSHVRGSTDPSALTCRRRERPKQTGLRISSPSRDQPTRAGESDQASARSDSGEMMSPKPSASAAADGGSGASTSRSAQTARSTPLQVVHILGNFMRIWSVYSLYNHLSSGGDSIVGFIFSCLVPASIIFLVLQKPWKGRPLHNSQVVPSVVNGGILALYFVLWGKGLLACGPLV